MIATWWKTGLLVAALLAVAGSAGTAMAAASDQNGATQPSQARMSAPHR